MGTNVGRRAALNIVLRVYSGTKHASPRTKQWLYKWLDYPPQEDETRREWSDASGANKAKNTS